MTTVKGFITGLSVRAVEDNDAQMKKMKDMKNRLANVPLPLYEALILLGLACYTHFISD